jgi:hypothetical protein
MTRPYGAPLHCPKCEPKHYYGVLKLQGGPKNLRCPNCSTLLVNVPKRRLPAHGHTDTTGGQRGQVPEGIAVHINEIGMGAAIAIDDFDANAAAS